MKHKLFALLSLLVIFLAPIDQILLFVAMGALMLTLSRAWPLTRTGWTLHKTASGTELGNLNLPSNSSPAKAPRRWSS